LWPYEYVPRVKILASVIISNALIEVFIGFLETGILV
jgi:hypothetical protein